MPLVFGPEAHDPTFGADGSISVPGAGPRSGLLIVGDTPSESDARQGRPFVGRVGAEQDRYISNAGMRSSQFYKTYAVKTYLPNNPDPTPELIARWTPTLEHEIEFHQPRFVLAVGRFAARWFLDDDVDMEMVHGLPHHSDRVPPGCIVIPCHHPAHGFYQDDVRVLVAYDYDRAIGIINGRYSADPVVNEVTDTDYRDVSGSELASIAQSAYRAGLPEFGIDTEGIPVAPWSAQVSFEDGQGLVLRCTRDDFNVGIRAIRRLVERGVECDLHNGMYDIEMCRVMGLDLADARIFDSMYAAYIMRTEPQGLKPLAYRWLGMRMKSYMDTVGPAGLEKQLAYLFRVAEGPWPKPEPRLEYENDGTVRVYTPQPVQQRASAIIADFYGGKLDKDGERTDPYKRWHKVDRALRKMVESDPAYGPMGIGTLDDIPLPDAIAYAACDPDATRRLARRLRPELSRRGLTQLMLDGMEVLPVFEEMQYNGMPASLSYFRKLHDDMWDAMCRLQARISNRYYGGLPFNPASPDKVAALMRRRGLVGEKRSKKTGKVSTGKKSIEHLRYEDPAMADVIDWREHQKIKDSFCTPVIERIEDTAPPGVDSFPVRTTIKTTRVATRRVSASDPNLTAIPTRHELGKRVRDGYIAPEGEEYGSWDLSQIEMRHMAHESKDPLLVKFFNDPRLDVHCETAARIFGLKVYPNAPTKEEMYQEIDELLHRYPSKRAGFGIITNIMGPGLLDQLRMFGCKGWDVEKCDDLITEWLKVYKGVAEFLNACKAEVRQNGMVRDCWGMPRYLPGVWSADKRVQAEAERAASSHKIQGGAQGMIQRSMAWLRPYIRAMQEAGENVHWVLQIHDELILRFDKNLWDVLNPLVREALTEHSMKLIVPIKCSGSHAPSWGKLK